MRRPLLDARIAPLNLLPSSFPLSLDVILNDYEYPSHSGPPGAVLVRFACASKYN